MRKLGTRKPQIAAAVTGAAGTLVILAILQLLCATGVIPQDQVASPTDTFRALADLVSQGSFWSDTWKTVQAWALGLGIAALAAIPAGFLIGSSERAFRSTRVLVDFLRPIPTVALLPLFILLFSGLRLNAYMAALAAFWPLLIQAIYGVRDVDPVARDTGRAYRLGRLKLIMFIVVPSALPYVATGLRIAGTVALAVVVAAEMVVGTPGLGKAIVDAQQGIRVDEMYGLIAAAGLLGLGLTALLVGVERRVLAWHPSQREGGS
ncbi:MAG TPA: ABC transporter permease subunit [Solirubrobacterales bacterium]|nr:ABC transporter permease subunit [Solirubrobacterales bacterium]